MTKENFTAIAVIIDASSSMGHLQGETIGSFNQFLADQKIEPGEAAFSLCTFNTDYRLVHDFVPLANVPNLDARTYRPNGMTALLDAMGTTIDSLGAKLANMQEQDRPSKVIVLVITDGEENSSRRFTLDQIKDKVSHQRDAYSWEFVFMGANIDAIGAGTSMGISASNSVSYDSTVQGTHKLYQSVSSNMRSYRASNSSKADFFNQPVDQTVSGSGGAAVISPVGAPTDPAGITGSVKPAFDPGHSLPTTRK
jgi:uncharacterized protein YegL